MGVCSWCLRQEPQPAMHEAHRVCLLGHAETLELCGRHTAEAVAVVRFCAACAPDRTVVTWTVDGVAKT